MHDALTLATKHIGSQMVEPFSDHDFSDCFRRASYRPNLRWGTSQQYEDVSAKRGSPDPQHGCPFGPHLSEWQAATIAYIRQQQCVAVPMGSLLTAEGDNAGCWA